MKKVILFLAFFSAGILLSAATDSKDNGNAAVTATKLNVRMKPSIKSDRAGTLFKGDRVKVTGKQGAWLELDAALAVKVYISEVYYINGKLTNATHLRAGKSQESPSYGILPAGTVLKAVGESDRYGWLQVVPPEDLRVYAYCDYIALDEAAKIEEKPAAAKKSVPATTDTAAEAEKKEVKTEKVEAPAAPAAPEVPANLPAVETEKKETVKPAEKKEVKKEVAKPAVKKEVKKEAVKPVAKKEVKKEAVKPVAKKEVKKETVKPAAKKVEKPAAAAPEKAEPKQDAEFAKKLAADLEAIGAKDANERTTISGKLRPIPASTSPVSDYALFAGRQNQGYVCGKDAKFFKDNAGKELTLSGKVYRIKGWKSFIVVVD